jgi:hypothetical protein
MVFPAAADFLTFLHQDHTRHMVQAFFSVGIHCSTGRDATLPTLWLCHYFLTQEAC